MNQQVTDITILEGVGALRSEFRRYLSLGVFVECTKEICLGRGVARDTAMGTEEEITKLWETYFSDESAYFERDRPEEFADVVIDGTRSFTEQLAVARSAKEA